MKKIFVVTDNKFMYEVFKRLANNRAINIDYYCSPKSQSLFYKEIENNQIIPLHLKDNESEILGKNYDLGISCHSKQLFPKMLVQSITCINIHPGLNPYNRGWFPQVFSIINGLPIGATIHLMDEEIDHGDIIIQEEILIYSHDTSLNVYQRVQAKEVELLEMYFDDIVSTNYKTIKPSHEGNYNGIEDYKKLCKINLDTKVTMKEAINYLRAMTHPPYKNSYFIDEYDNKIFVSIELEKGK